MKNVNDEAFSSPEEDRSGMRLFVPKIEHYKSNDGSLVDQDPKYFNQEEDVVAVNPFNPDGLEDLNYQTVLDYFKTLVSKIYSYCLQDSKRDQQPLKRSNQKKRLSRKKGSPNSSESYEFSSDD